MPDVLTVLLLLALGVLLYWALLWWAEAGSFDAPSVPFDPHEISRARATAQEIDDLANAALRDMASVVSDHLQRRQRSRS